jgi:hypothetical protein
MPFLGFADRPDAPGLPPGAPDGSAGFPADEPHPRHHDPHGFLTTLGAWGISILLHAGVLLLSVFLVWSTNDTTASQQEEVIIPIARLSATPGAPLSLRSGTADPMQNAAANAPSRAVVTPVSAAAIGRSVTGASASMGLSRATGGAGTGSGSGSGSGSGEGSGGGPGWGGMGLGGGGGGGGGKGSPFGSGVGGGGGGMKVSFAGTGGNAYRLIYLIDASGSLIDTLPFVINELKRSITELSEKQQFTVIFFQGDEAVEVPVPQRGLKPATADVKQKVIQWIDPSAGNIVPQGLSNPVKALKLALQYKPQLLFILSDNITGKGRYEVDQRRLLEDIERTNTANTKINTIQFLYPDPLTKVGMKGTLELIAANSGGTYKFLDGRELGIQ